MAARCLKTREHGFPTKRRDFFKLIGPVTALWLLQPSEVKHMVFTEHLLAKAVCTMSINVLGWQPGASKPGSTVFRQNVVIF